MRHELQLRNYMIEKMKQMDHVILYNENCAKRHHHV